MSNWARSSPKGLANTAFETSWKKSLSVLSSFLLAAMQSVYIGMTIPAWLPPLVGLPTRPVDRNHIIYMFLQVFCCCGTDLALGASVSTECPIGRFPRRFRHA